MTVKRIIANIATADLNVIQAFYRDIFDLELVMGQRLRRGEFAAFTYMIQVVA